MTTPTRKLGPGEYWFEDLAPGDFYETGHIVVTETHIVNFAGLSGDFFDVHMDDEFAREQGFSSRLAHGILVLALTDGLKNRTSVHLKAVASLGWNWKFSGPVYVGDRIGAKIEVVAKRVSSKGHRLVTLHLDVTKQDGHVVQTGETTLVLRSKPTALAPGEPNI